MVKEPTGLSESEGDRERGSKNMGDMTWDRHVGSSIPLLISGADSARGLRLLINCCDNCLFREIIGMIRLSD